MTTISDEDLMAYVDGELADEDRAAVERAIAADGELAARVAAQRSLRDALAASYGPTLQERVPDRLLETLRRPAPAMPAPVSFPRREDRHAPLRARFRPVHWGAMAASLLVGIVTTSLWTAAPRGVPVRAASGTLQATGALASALDDRLSADRTGPITVAFSFRDRGGAVCRTFEIRDGMAGLACRDGANWRIDVMAAPAARTAGDYAQAGSSLPPSVLAAVDARIDGEPLDAAMEARIKVHGWQTR